MKRSSYFISARSASADILASELVLAMNDQFPKVECLGIFGEWSGRTRSSPLGDLQTCLSLGLHDKSEMSEAAKTFYTQLIQELEKNLSRQELADLIAWVSMKGKSEQVEADAKTIEHLDWAVAAFKEKRAPRFGKR